MSVVGVVNSLLSDFNLSADLCEETAARVSTLLDFLTSNKRASFLEVCGLNEDEATCCAFLPPIVSIDFLSKVCEDREQGSTRILVQDDDV